MKGRETHYPKWNQPPLEERWGAQPGGRITHCRVTIQLLFLGTFARRAGDCFGTTGIWTCIYLYIYLAGCWHTGCRRVSSQRVKVLSESGKKCGVLEFFFECSGGKDKRGEGGAGETWLQAAAKWTSNDMTHAYLRPPTFRLILMSRPFFFLSKTGMHFSCAERRN